MVCYTHAFKSQTTEEFMAKKPSKASAPAKRTPAQRRKATAKAVEKMLPEKPTKGGETVVPDALLRRVKRELEG